MKQYTYTAGMTHNHSSVVRLNRVLHSVRHKWQRLFFIVVGLGLIMLGVFGPYNPTMSTLAVGLGCWSMLLVNYDARAKTREMEKNLHGYYPKIRYRFGETQIDMQIKEEHQPLEYRHIDRWATDRQYIYFFPQGGGVFMIDAATLQPGDPDGFRDFIQQRCKAKWTFLGNIDYGRILRKLKKAVSRGGKE